MKEDFLHYIWKTKNFDLKNLSTTDGQNLSLSILGSHNMNAGPDFLNAKIKIGETTWVGHIEIHINASDWYKHKHHEDKAYNNVILHVVYNNDKTIKNENGQPLATFVLDTRINLSEFENYNDLMSSLNWVPCTKHLVNLDLSKMPIQLEGLVISRLISKYSRIKKLLDQSKNDWEGVLFQLLLRYFGLKVNGDAFEILAEKTPYKLLIKCESLFQKESLLFGQAGLLKNKDDYIISLENEYRHQKEKYSLQPMTGVEWKFSKLRPANFPSLRLAQIASLYHKTPQLFQQLKADLSLSNLANLLSSHCSEYWNTHYLPGKESPIRIKDIGSTTKDILIINVIVPIIFAYGHSIDNYKLKEKAVDILSEISSENNGIIRKWKSFGFSPKNASDTQALLQLKNEYCDTFKCLACPLGQQIIFGVS